MTPRTAARHAPLPKTRKLQIVTNSCRLPPKGLADDGPAKNSSCSDEEGEVAIPGVNTLPPAGYNVRFLEGLAFTLPKGKYVQAHGEALPLDAAIEYECDQEDEAWLAEQREQGGAAALDAFLLEEMIDRFEKDRYQTDLMEKLTVSSALRLQPAGTALQLFAVHTSMVLTLLCIRISDWILADVRLL
jgi:hypothetical protein